VFRPGLLTVAVAAVVAVVFTSAFAIAVEAAAHPGLVGVESPQPAAGASPGPPTGAAAVEASGVWDPGAARPSPAALVAVTFALARLGTPYRWGGTGPGGFDCSGLVQAAYKAAGIVLPRVAQAQFDAGPRLPPGVTPIAGDLVFFGNSPAAVVHVGIALGDGTMVDAPHTGAVVRVEPIPAARYVGATRPGG